MRHHTPHPPLAADATGAIAGVGSDAHRVTMSEDGETVKVMVEPSGVEPEFVSLPLYQCGR